MQLPMRAIALACIVAQLLSWEPTSAFQDVQLAWAADQWYNPSMVEADGKLWCVAKVTTFRNARKKTWWVNHLHLCQAPVASGVQALQCAAFNPWGGQRYEECEWDGRVRHGKLDVEGLGDVKLWNWPGRGVYAIFGRKPPLPANAKQLPQSALLLLAAAASVGGRRSLNAAKTAMTPGSRYCPGPLVYQQFLALVQREGPVARGAGRSLATAASSAAAAPNASSWLLAAPLALYVDGDLDMGRPPLAGKPAPHSAGAVAAGGGAQPVYMEKNWMPFVWSEGAAAAQGRGGQGSAGAEELLLVTYSVQPHRVLQLHSDGRAVPRWVTHNPHLFHKFADVDVHGGPCVVHVAAHLAGKGKPYYLGIMHHINRYDGGKGVGLVRVYRHFAFRFSATPPFAIDAISDELPLTFQSDHKVFRRRWVAFVSGLDVSPSSSQVRITYGAADSQARLLTLGIAELEAMFSGDVLFMDYNITYPRWSKPIGRDLLGKWPRDSFDLPVA